MALCLFFCCFHGSLGFYFLIAGGKMFPMNTKKMSDAERLRKMEKTFNALGGILVEDYEYFTRTGLPDAASRPNKAVRKSVPSNVLQVPALN